MAGSLDHGRLVAFSAEREVTADDVHILEDAATVAALAITKAHAVSAVESKYQADFVRDALAGNAGDAEHVIAHAHSLGWDVARSMVVLVAEWDPSPAGQQLAPGELRTMQERFATAWARVVRQSDPRAPVVGFSHEVVAVLGVAPGRRRHVDHPHRAGSGSPRQRRRRWGAAVFLDGDLPTDQLTR